MKRLALLRHAQAEPKSRQDFERVLSSRGRDEIAAIGRHIPADWPALDLALVSPAARTRETWERLGRAAVRVRFDERIYDATPETLLALVKGIDDAVGTAVLVGHNPGISEAASALLGAPGDLPANFPTAGFGLIAFPAVSWAAVAAGSGRAVGFIEPA